MNIPDSRAAKGGAGRFFIFLLFLAGVAAAFYGGTRYKGAMPFGLSRPAEVPPLSQQSATTADLFLKFEKARREVDRAPAEWLAAEVPKELARQKITNALDSTDPEFLYLYGRALLLAGNNDGAGNAFEQSIVRADQSPGVMNMTVRREATLALAAVTLRSNKEVQRALKHFDDMVTKPANTNVR